MWASSGCFECEQCKEQELRCGHCTRQRFCRRCAAERAARSTKRSGEKYRRTDRARELHRACSLAYYHRRGKEQRRQRLAQQAASQGPAPPGVAQPSDEAATDEGKDPVHSGECLTQKTVGDPAGQGATVGAARAVSTVQEPVSRGEAELVDAKFLVATVAQAQDALQDARKGGLDDVVLWGRCARCGRVGRVVHFDGVLRARAQALE